MPDTHDHHDHHEGPWHRASSLDRAAKHLTEALDEVYDRRAEAWAELVESGVLQKDIAERFEIDPSDVSRALSTRGL